MEGKRGSECLLKSVSNIDFNPEATAIFFCNDLMLYGAMQKMNQLKLNLFNRYSIIGYDDTFFNEIFNPEVSSVKQDVNKLGSDAVIMMLDAIKNKVVNQSKLRVEVNDRESVKQL